MGCGSSSAKKQASSPAFPPPPAPGKPPPRASGDLLEQKCRQASKVGVLVLKECGLKEVPKCALALDIQPKSVDLSMNSLVALPGSLDAWAARLASLSLSRNSLASVQALAPLRGLTKLSLDSNRITSLEGLDLPRLQTLDVSHNPLEALPASIGGCGALKELKASHCQLVGLPAELFACTNLASVDFASNKIFEIPAAVGQLKALTYANFSANQLSSVPGELLRDTPVSDLWLQGNQPALDKYAIREVPGYDAFMERRKKKIDQRIHSGAATEINVSVCGLE